MIKIRKQTKENVERESLSERIGCGTGAVLRNLWDFKFLYSCLGALTLLVYTGVHDTKLNCSSNAAKVSYQVDRIRKMEREMGAEEKISFDYEGRNISLRNGSKREGETWYSYFEMAVKSGENKIVFWDHNANGLGDAILETKSGDRIWINGNRTSLAEIRRKNQDLSDRLKEFYDSTCVHSYKFLGDREKETRTRYTQFREDLNKEMLNTLSALPSK